MRAPSWLRAKIVHYSGNRRLLAAVWMALKRIALSADL